MVSRAEVMQIAEKPRRVSSYSNQKEKEEAQFVDMDENYAFADGVGDWADLIDDVENSNNIMDDYDDHYPDNDNYDNENDDEIVIIGTENPQEHDDNIAEEEEFRKYSKYPARGYGGVLRKGLLEDQDVKPPSRNAIKDCKDQKPSSVLKVGNMEINSIQARLYGLCPPPSSSSSSSSSSLNPSSVLGGVLKSSSVLTSQTRKSIRTVNQLSSTAYQSDSFLMDNRMDESGGNSSTPPSNTYKACGYDFMERIQNRNPDVDRLFRGQGTSASSSQGTSKAKKAELEGLKRDYEAKLDKLYCRRCCRNQTFDEFWEKKRVCSQCQSRFEPRIVTDGRALERRMKDAQSRRDQRLEKIEQEVYGNVQPKSSRQRPLSAPGITGSSKMNQGNEYTPYATSSQHREHPSTNAMHINANSANDHINTNINRNHRSDNNNNNNNTNKKNNTITSAKNHGSEVDNSSRHRNKMNNTMSSTSTIPNTNSNSNSTTSNSTTTRGKTAKNVNAIDPSLRNIAPSFEKAEQSFQLRQDVYNSLRHDHQDPMEMNKNHDSSTWNRKGSKKTTSSTTYQNGNPTQRGSSLLSSENNDQQWKQTTEKFQKLLFSD